MHFIDVDYTLCSSGDTESSLGLTHDVEFPSSWRIFHLQCLEIPPSKVVKLSFAHHCSRGCILTVNAFFSYIFDKIDRCKSTSTEFSLHHVLSIYAWEV